MTIRNKTTNIYTEWKPLIDSLPDDTAGKIFKAIFLYQSNEEVKLDNSIWFFIKSKIDEYNEKLENISKKRKISGSYGGLAKASKCYQMLANDSKCSNKIKEKKIKEEKNTKKEENPLWESFTKFWEIYPKTRPGSKQKAFIAYCKAINERGYTIEQIYNGCVSYSKSDEALKNNGEFAKGCAPWLNDDRFLNKYTEHRIIW